MLRLISLGGLLLLVGLCYVLSRDRKAVSWRLVGVGLLIQAALGATFLADQGAIAFGEAGSWQDQVRAIAGGGLLMVSDDQHFRGLDLVEQLFDRGQGGDRFSESHLSPDTTFRRVENVLRDSDLIIVEVGSIHR